MYQISTIATFFIPLYFKHLGNISALCDISYAILGYFAQKIAYFRRRLCNDGFAQSLAIWAYFGKPLFLLPTRY